MGSPMLHPMCKGRAVERQPRPHRVLEALDVQAQHGRQPAHAHLLQRALLQRARLAGPPGARPQRLGPHEAVQAAQQADRAELGRACPGQLRRGCCAIASGLNAWCNPCCRILCCCCACGQQRCLIWRRRSVRRGRLREAAARGEGEAA